MARIGAPAYLRGMSGPTLGGLPVAMFAVLIACAVAIFAVMRRPPRA
jgi:hypothetical protein